MLMIAFVACLSTLNLAGLAWQLREIPLSGNAKHGLLSWLYKIFLEKDREHGSSGNLAFRSYKIQLPRHVSMANSYDI
jgi:hypothetical protein